jgi:hypothetical protein
MRDYASFGWRSVLQIPVVPFASGTATALAFTGGDACVQVPFACKIVSAYARVITGGTVASATWGQVLVKSTAGTTAAAAVGTFAPAGTVATASTVAGSGFLVPATLASTLPVLAAGDILSVCPAIATVAVVGTWAYEVLVEELPS